ncbi:hypothetical protein [Streptomyces blattellae]|uniref:hypothetical protein n=1 Tax=Streptomyces blattellae TaxID=2569855 RepID=UPI0012B849A2|nr:hypothetical protein [Streptomyces blattellae]
MSPCAIVRGSVDGAQDMTARTTKPAVRRAAALVRWVGRQTLEATNPPKATA